MSDDGIEMQIDESRLHDDVQGWCDFCGVPTKNGDTRLFLRARNGILICTECVDLASKVVLAWRERQTRLQESFDGGAP